jgi:hypothetical protein
LLYKGKAYTQVKRGSGTVIWSVMLIVNGLELSRRVVRNRGSIDSGREEGRNRSRNWYICQSKS